MPRLRRSSLIVLAACTAALAGCETTPASPPYDEYYSPRPEAAPPAPAWSDPITAADRDRLARLDQAWTTALSQARTQRGSGDLRSLGELIVPDAQRPSVTPPPGDYRCRTVKLGDQSGGGDGLGYVVYGWFACRIEATPEGLKFTKRTGSQRPAGLLFADDDRRMVLLGSMALADEPTAHAYGLNPDRDLVAVLERIGERRWRLVIPWPVAESNLDILELVPA